VAHPQQKEHPFVTDTQLDTPAPEDRAPTRSKRRRRWIIAGGIATMLVVFGAAGIWYFAFRDTAPPAVNIDRASESVDSGKTSAGSTIDGTWAVDTSIGSFSDFTSAFVGYRVNEELAGVGAKTAYGRTPDVSGTLTIAGTTVTDAGFEANLSTLESDESLRDMAIHRQAIETDQFPSAKFVLSDPIELDGVPKEGETVKVNATGKLALHGVTRTVTVPLEAKFVNDEIIVTGQIDIAFADYGIEKPMSFKVLSIEDKGVMELQLFFTRQ
jgi:polyisoprenoid-binding protein YceI